VSEERDAGEEWGEKGPLQRTIDLCVFAPVGVAVTVVEELPDLISKGRERVERQLGNARVVGRFVVHKSGRSLAGRLDEVLGNDSGGRSPDPIRSEPPAEGTEPPSPMATPTPEPPTVRTAPAPDVEVEAAVRRALADYDTLSASQVVRRLESLGDDELRAVQRYEASHRNRRTILNRAGQLLDSGAAGSSPGYSGSPSGY
jgi:hypothetical protein